jgi:hypothetical protein
MRFWATGKARSVVAASVGLVLVMTACTSSKAPKQAAQTTTNPSTSGPGRQTHSLVACRGTWESLDPAQSGGMLLGVSTTAPDDAWAAGRDGAGHLSVVHWDGRAWTTAFTGPNGAFYSVKALSATDVWASGRGRGGAISYHFDGRGWKDVPLGISEVTGSSILIELAPRSSNDIWGVGLFTDHDASFFVHWDGTSWSLDPKGLQAGAALRSISQDSEGGLWSVGETVTGPLHAALLEHWQAGKGWNTVPTGIPPSKFLEFHGVLAISGDDIWTTGYEMAGFATKDAADVGTALHFDGTGVHLVPMAKASPNDRPRHAAALAPNDLWAVGDSNLTGPLTEHWDGTQWTVVANPAKDRLFGVAALPASGEVWAVGYGPTILHFCR